LDRSRRTWPRVVFCSRATIPGPSAAALNVVQCCSALAARGVDVTLIRSVKVWRPATWGRGIGRFYGQTPAFKVYRLLELPRCGLYFDSQVAKEAARTGALLYTRDSRILTAAIGRKVPFVLEVHGKQDPRRLETVLEGIEGGLCRGIVAITEALKALLVQYCPRLEPYILVAPDAVEPARFDSIPPASGNLALGYVGSLYPGKGMEIIAPLAEEIPEFDIHVYGGHARQVARWRRHCRHLRNLHFHGYVKPSNVPACFSKFTIGLLPNQPKVLMANGSDIGSYTSPMKLFEYMAAGKLVVASDIPVLREVIRDQENGVLVDHREPRAWATAIRRLAQDDDLREKLIRRARDEAVREYSYSVRFKRILRHVESVTRELAGNDHQ
jgi:glycosyltransferase involved in cell wall biosynthesis